MKIIVIGDSHSRVLWAYRKNEDGHIEKYMVPMRITNRRYDWLAQLIIDEIKNSDAGEEIVVVDIGDFADMKSLSNYDKGKKPAENERIQLDIDYARDARLRITAPVIEYLAKQKKAKRRCPKVRFVACLGNHENRWSRLKKDEPLWDIFDGVDDISGAAELGWEVYPFLKPVNINGVNFCHYFESGPMGKPIGGAMPARSIILKMHESCVAGHLHEYHIHRESTALGVKIGMVCGCYFEAEEDYAGIQGNPRYWKGIVVLDNVMNGDYEERKIPLSTIKKKYIKDDQGPYDIRSLNLKESDII